MMKITDFVPFIAADIPDCPPFIAERAAIESVIEFCKKSWVLNAMIDPEDVEQDEPLYKFQAPSNKPMCGILEANFNEEPLDFYSSKEMDRRKTKWRRTKGTPVEAVKEGLDSIRLYPVPDMDYPESLQVRVAYSPRMTDTVVDDIFSSHYFKAITDGATARLLLQQQKPWFNPSLVLPYRMNFENELYSARNLVMRDIYQRRPPVPQL